MPASRHSPHIAGLHRALGLPADYAAIRGLEFQPEASASDLIAAPHATGTRPVLLLAPAAAAWTRLHDTAAAEGIALLAFSGFRSVERQAEIIRAKLATGMHLDAVLRLIAAPGYSEHHTGRAIDLGVPGEPPLEESFGETAAFRWLGRRAGEFGFRLSFPRGNPHAIAYEPWHWCWHPSATG